jgi:hypothetical protein
LHTRDADENIQLDTSLVGIHPRQPNHAFHVLRLSPWPSSPRPHPSCRHSSASHPAASLPASPCPPPVRLSCSPARSTYYHLSTPSQLDIVSEKHQTNRHDALHIHTHAHNSFIQPQPQGPASRSPASDRYLPLPRIPLKHWISVDPELHQQTRVSLAFLPPSLTPSSALLGGGCQSRPKQTPWLKPRVPMPTRPLGRIAPRLEHSPVFVLFCFPFACSLPVSAFSPRHPNRHTTARQLPAPALPALPARPVVPPCDSATSEHGACPPSLRPPALGPLFLTCRQSESFPNAPRCPPVPV